MDSFSLPRCTRMQKERSCSERSWSCRCTSTCRLFQLRLNRHFRTCWPSSPHQYSFRDLLGLWRWRWSAQMPTALHPLAVTGLRVVLATSLSTYVSCNITTIFSQRDWFVITAWGCTKEGMPASSSTNGMPTALTSWWTFYLQWGACSQLYCVGSGPSKRVCWRCLMTGSMRCPWPRCRDWCRKVMVNGTQREETFIKLFCIT